MQRFTPKKRIALDGRLWWCIWDNARNGWSTLLCHSKYKTRKDAQFSIEYYALKGWY